MIKLNFIWKKQERQYQQGEDLYLNRICVAGYDWNSSGSREETEETQRNTRYVGRVYLVGLINHRFYGESPESLKVKLEQKIEAWFNEALKEQ